MRVNCDIGERGSDHPIDQQLIATVDIANIACGGHAGDGETVEAFRRIAADHGVQVTAHLSYPDRANFGRKSMNIPPRELIRSLEEQRQLMADVSMVKFHGALYNDSCTTTELAQLLGSWLRDAGFTHVLTMPSCALAQACEKLDLTVISEAFAERRYQLDESTQHLILRPRRYPDATIVDMADAITHVENIVLHHAVTTADGQVHRLECDTICIHSDSPIALELAQKLRGAFGA